MHSSRMRAALLLPVSPSMHCAGGYLLQGEVSALGGPAPRGCLLRGVSALGWWCLLWEGDVYFGGGVCCQGLSAPEGVSAPGGGVSAVGGVSLGVYPSMH